MKPPQPYVTTVLVNPLWKYEGTKDAHGAQKYVKHMQNTHIP